MASSNIRTQHSGATPGTRIVLLTGGTLIFTRSPAEAARLHPSLLIAFESYLYESPSTASAAPHLHQLRQPKSESLPRQSAVVVRQSAQGSLHQALASAKNKERQRSHGRTPGFRLCIQNKGPNIRDYSFIFSTKSIPK